MRIAGFIHTPAALALLLTVAGCSKPPASAYEQASSTSTGLPVGQNSAGEGCTLQRLADGRADIYCGSWDQPSAHVQIGGAASAATLPGLAASSPWRAGLDAAYVCEAPQPARILDGVPAEILPCTQRFGGWPYVALAAEIDGKVYYADGVQPALPAMQRGIGVVSGRVPAAAAGQAGVAQSDQLLAQRLAAHAFSSGDVGQYDALMALGAQANQAENFPAAVIAYRAALALQQKKLGADNPGTVIPMLALGLNLSNQGLYAQAQAQFATAAALAPRASDPTAPAVLRYDEALDALNQGQSQRALARLQEARQAYAALVPPALLQAQPQAAQNNALFSISAPAGADTLLADQVTLNSPVTQAALLGVIECWRYQALVLERIGDRAGSDAAIANARRIASANGLEPPSLDARLDRTRAVLASANGQPAAAAADLARAAASFNDALPGSRPVAQTDLLRGAALAQSGDTQAALSACRDGIALLRKLRLGGTAGLIGPCLDVYAKAATDDPARAGTLHSEMFEAAELTQGSVTTQEIAQAAARLASSANDPKVASAIRAQQDAQHRLADLYQQRDQAAHTANNGAALARLDKDIAAATARLQQAGLAEQAAAPNYGQLVQQVVPATEVLKLLRPDEAFLGITTTPRHSWLFFLHAGRVDVAQANETDRGMARLVKQVRASIEPGTNGLPAFDMADAATIYADTLGPFAAQMAGVHDLVVAPSGALLALPFALLPTGPASATDLAHAPWLIRQTTLAYVPAAANFVSLRRAEGTSAAKQPWFGFGDFRPVSLAQAQATYSPAACPQAAAEFAGLPQLPYAKLELQAASAIFGAGPQDELLGAGFTVPDVEKADLKNFQILHFATHALLPTDLPCQAEPAIVTSAPAGAASADQAQLTTSDVMGLKLDANLVVLSACNTGGGEEGGEALSGLARSFFFAGARAMLVTQWSVNDQVSAYLVADTLSRLHAASAGGAAGSLRAAQLALISGAGKGFPAQIADPFYWAAFTVIGDGGAEALSGSGK
ncbi:CHAT domain-containing protein [Acidocella facilis]|uniref:CHAT domain-containing protein n=1 Tax=Acidocella facilis TaxID=525 RepID=UPI001F33CDAA|nr:CHAT domain-containing protein [Acidocella facilis]